jgi:MipA family protein
VRRKAVAALFFLYPLICSAEPRPLWEFGLGVGAFSVPDYRGSDESRGYVLPFPYLVYRGDFLRVDREGPRAILVETLRAELDLSFGGSLPVKSRGNRARQGMPDLDPTLEVGPQLNWTLLGTRRAQSRLDLRLPARLVATTDLGLTHLHYAGHVFYPHLEWIVPLGRWELEAEGGALYGSRRFHRYFYGVDAQYATPERPAYDARGGYSGAVLSANLTRRFAKLWAGCFLTYDRVRGAVFDDSPLVKRGSGVSAGFALAWMFAESVSRE